MKERAKEMLIGENMKLIVITLHSLFDSQGFFAPIIDHRSGEHNAVGNPVTQ